MTSTIDKRFDTNVSFYQKIRPFIDFNDVTDLSNYTPLPAGWVMVMADIKGSTKAINEGRYKDVNMMGAACITAILNVTRGYEIPYVFGGDGATLTIPYEVLPRVKEALLGAQKIAQTQFDLDLRIGAVPVEDIRQLGVDILVAKFQLSEGNYLAMFSGGGVECVDRLVKDDVDKNYHLASTNNMTETANLEGLSCRWEPLKSRNGQMLSLLAQARTKQGTSLQTTYNRILKGIANIIGNADLSPVHSSNLHFKWPPRGLKSEIKATGIKAFKLYKESLIQWFLEKFDLTAGSYNAPRYRNELRANSDFRRFDDTLRLVLDCSEDQVRAIDAFLFDMHHAGDIVYGLHTADSALMTCLVFNLTQSEHIHFIDGANGGFALAATQLKAQLKML